MTAPLGPARAFDLAARDLHAIAQRLATMHDIGWTPAQPDHDRPTLTLPAGAGPDDVPGPAWDPGLGDYRVRQGWQRMVCHLAHAEQTMTDVLCAALGLQSRPVPPCRPTGLVDVQVCVRRLQDRTGDLRGLWREWSGERPETPTWRVDQPRARWLARQLDPPFEHIRQAMYETQRAVPIVGSGKPPATCTQCRRLGSIGQPRIGGVCYACDQRNKRAGIPRRTTVVAKQRRATIKATRRR